jgi:hypothetical protein
LSCSSWLTRHLRSVGHVRCLSPFSRRSHVPLKEHNCSGFHLDVNTAFLFSMTSVETLKKAQTALSPARRCQCHIITGVHRDSHTNLATTSLVHAHGPLLHVSMVQ